MQISVTMAIKEVVKPIFDSLGQSIGVSNSKVNNRTN